MGKLYEFPLPQQFKITLPRGASASTEFEAITIPDDSLSRDAIYKGDIVVVQIGLFEHGEPHAVLTASGAKYVGFVEFRDDLIFLKSNHEDFEPEVFKRDELMILGSVVQKYSGGDIEKCWERRREQPPRRRRKKQGSTEP